VQCEAQAAGGVQSQGGPAAAGACSARGGTAGERRIGAQRAAPDGRGAPHRRIGRGLGAGCRRPHRAQAAGRGAASSHRVQAEGRGAASPLGRRPRGGSPPALTGMTAGPMAAAAGRAAAGSTGYPLPPLDCLDCMAAGVEKSTYLARGNLRGRRRKSSVEAMEGRPLAPSPDESSVEELLRVRVVRGEMRSPHPSGAGREQEASTTALDPQRPEGRVGIGKRTESREAVNNKNGSLGPLTTEH
jgi:hypothetical protein